METTVESGGTSWWKIGAAVAAVAAVAFGAKKARDYYKAKVGAETKANNSSASAAE